MRHELATIRRSVNFEWERITVAATAREENRHLDGMPAAALAEARGVDVLDAVLDLALDEDLATVFRIDRQQGPAHVEFRKRMAQHPLLMAGASDAGAHLQTFCGADYPTRVLKDLVPDPLTLEQAVHKLIGTAGGDARSRGSRRDTRGRVRGSRVVRSRRGWAS